MIPRMPRGSRGVTIVEFALVLPLLFVLIFSIVDFGLYFFIEHTLQFATREGARLALVGRTLNDGQGNRLSREASIIKAISDKAQIAIDPSRLQISIFPVAAGYGDPADWQNTQDAGGPGTYMRVTTRYVYTFVTPLLWTVVPNGHLQITAQATYRNELF
jgi:Flp pilus assembly protein TadG